MTKSTRIKHTRADRIFDAIVYSVLSLLDVYKRQGFTSGYLDGKIDGTMFGVRSEAEMCIRDSLRSLGLTDALVVQNAVLSPQHPQLTGAEGFAAVAQLRQL